MLRWLSWNIEVLLIDLDPQANLTLALGIDLGENEQTASNILIESSPLMGAIRTTDVSHVEIIPCNSKIETAEQYLPMRTGYVSTLRRAIMNASPLVYDYILMDCPPALGAITLNALSAANLLVIPSQAEYFSAYALRNMMNMIRRVRNEINADLAYRILITMFDRRNRTHRNISDQLRGTFGEGVFTTIIEVDTKLRESPDRRPADHSIQTKYPRRFAIPRACTGTGGICQRRNHNSTSVLTRFLRGSSPTKRR